jgi:sortase A
VSSRSKSLLRGVLFCVLIGGIVLTCWPLGQSAYGWWSQRSLRAAWQSHAQTPKALPPRPAVRATAVKAAPAKAEPKAKPSARRTAPFPLTRIVIPEIGVDAVVVQGMDAASLRRGPGHLPSSAPPGAPGNCVISAHRNVFGAWFADLDRLWAGSHVELHTPQQIYVYKVLSTEQIPETDTSILAPPTDDSALLTLITCTSPAGFYRHVVVASLVE